MKETPIPSQAKGGKFRRSSKIINKLRVANYTILEYKKMYLEATKKIKDLQDYYINELIKLKK